MSATDPHILGPGLLPTPFTADEIREATGAGKTIRLRVEQPDGSTGERVNRFRETDAEGATLDRWAAETPEAVVSSRVTWAELQSHAAFPSDRTSVTTETLDTPLGSLTCQRYDTADEPGDPVESFWFSLAHPGMPIRYEVPIGDGVMRTTAWEITRD
ncbi:hypothetical protein [Microbacterium phyllosphaerae]|uniref:hypothetical protein n=1 Tax=Microbacterium phyllosphaerae TaxID=124798 RepID=UPI0021695438|nr:hypothetical protein [Microbacterium phyllosphaerae]MCS3442764.1 hypothetical protein [Microbacterium phyllosphaerae]